MHTVTAKQWPHHLGRIATTRRSRHLDPCISSRSRAWRLLLAIFLFIGAVSANLITPANSAAQPCDTQPTGVAPENYFLDFKVPAGLMPDPQFDNWPARIRVHRVSPTYANGPCPSVPRRAAVLVHGRSIAAAPTFDLQINDGVRGISVQENLARAGIDTFAPDVLGYGRSTVMSDRILYYGSYKARGVVGSIDGDSSLQDVKIIPDGSFANDWTAITALSGDRILYYSASRGLVLIGSIDVNNTLRDVTPHYGYETDWTQVVALSGDRILFYSVSTGRGRIETIDANNALHVAKVYNPGSFADDWTEITALSGDRILYYSAIRGLLLLGSIDVNNILQDVTVIYPEGTYEHDWTQVAALSGDRVLFYSAPTGRGRIFPMRTGTGSEGVEIPDGSFAQDWSEITFLRPPDKREVGINDPGNASRPDDTTPNAQIFPLDQQQKLLWANPLDGHYRPHSSSTRFARSDVWVRDIRQVIDDAVARAQPTDPPGKVALIGYSLGGHRAVRTLSSANPILPPAANTITKVSKLALVAPFPFNSPASPPVEPSAGFASFPLTLTNFTIPLDTENLPPACKVGPALPSGTMGQFDAQRREEETLGHGWGGTSPGYPTGLVRNPTFSSTGFNNTDVGQLTPPTLVIGAKNDTTPGMNPPGVFGALPASMTNKVLAMIDCASHNLLMETCGSAKCKPDSGTPYGGTTSQGAWSGPYSTVNAALIEWITNGTFNGKTNGSFDVDRSGCVNTTPPSCVASP